MNWSEEDLAAHYAKLKQPQPGAETPLPASDKSEANIQQECVKLMQEDGWRALRTDPVSNRSKAKGFGELGMADYQFTRPFYRHNDDSDTRRMNTCNRAATQTVWAEFKARKGNVASHQTDWHNKERARGFLTIIASVDFPASVEGFRNWYEKSGLMRRMRWW